MPNEPSLEEIVANKTGIEPDYYCKSHRYYTKFEANLLLAILKHTNLEPVDLMGYYLPFIIPTSKHFLGPKMPQRTATLNPTSSFLDFNKHFYPIPKIPFVTPKDLTSVFEYEDDIQFGEIIPIYINNPWGIRPKATKNSLAKYKFEQLYGIQLDDVYISLYELASDLDICVHDIIPIDDFFIAQKGSRLTIYDNDLPYGAKDSREKYECHLKPVGCIELGTPVKYIKTVNDYGETIKGALTEQKDRSKHIEKELCKSYKGYFADIDFIIKTGIHEFIFLGYDRLSKDGNFYITDVHYNINGSEPEYTTKKCDFEQLSQTMDAIQRAHAKHFNKMYSSKNR